jgi:CRISPR-associated protein Cmr3
MNIEYRFVQPVDTLSIRGNKLFGDPGSYGESSFPPRPSVLAGAFRSLLLSQQSGDIRSFANGERLKDPDLDRILGIPGDPGSFRIESLFPAWRTGSHTEILFPVPAEVMVFENGEVIEQMDPQSLPCEIQSNLNGTGLPCLPILRQAKQSKPENGWLLNQAGIARYLKGERLERSHLRNRSELWTAESRVGIGLSEVSGTAIEGRLFSVEHTSVRQPEHGTDGSTAVGLVVGMSGCGTRLPQSGFLRLGGDGRAAHFCAAGAAAELPEIRGAASNGRFKLVMLSAGIFRRGWLPESVAKQGSTYRLCLPDFTARLACSAVSRFETVSGWDLARWTPKTAERAAPAGSVYWFDDAQGAASELEKLAKRGIWAEDMNNEERSRQAEGFNRILIGAW